ncbi:5-formyltetrahydrofolate cyclo-ligase [Parendozoicomonas haliclonae]|uniref:5-formyltetrahydrofolate cyclo-ligase n=1 Tax=Parendozoicomonas haliclonae TaxID=1960125 RepID=A0A1X7AFZ8_9GAMM|nr:5-formyltetrahydrofolate cyclo-ligase [Parendozoicomonas haliclonae]SMA39043.1 5-formyltetrahydrofolate cyclo-ligase family protein [Parendozoicomonas haliclonae]
MPASKTSKQQLRKQLRHKRNSLTSGQQHQAALGLQRIISAQPAWIRSQHIAVYIANDGEIDPMPLVKQAWKEGKTVYLPVLEPLQSGKLLFLPWRPDTVLVNNRYGIPEPTLRRPYRFRYRPRPAWALDLVLLPLTGFDSSGKRMGMGGGFYDRTFAFMKNANAINKPFLAGLAHECQRVSRIPTDSWDIPLSAIYSDLNVYP